MVLRDHFHLGISPANHLRHLELDLMKPDLGHTMDFENAFKNRRRSRAQNHSLQSLRLKQGFPRTRSNFIPSTTARLGQAWRLLGMLWHRRRVQLRCGQTHLICQKKHNFRSTPLLSLMTPFVTNREQDALEEEDHR